MPKHVDMLNQTARSCQLSRRIFKYDKRGQYVTMRYRVFQNEQFLGTFQDRPTFQEAYLGDNPNSPAKGDKILWDEKTYVVKWYTEHDSESFTENEFHQKENDWFADIIVK